MKNHNVTTCTCAACYSISQVDGKVSIDECPVCKNNDERTKARYWFDGNPDYTESMMSRDRKGGGKKGFVVTILIMLLMFVVSCKKSETTAPSVSPTMRSVVIKNTTEYGGDSTDPKITPRAYLIINNQQTNINDKYVDTISIAVGRSVTVGFVQSTITAKEYFSIVVIGANGMINPKAENYFQYTGSSDTTFVVQ